MNDGVVKFRAMIVGERPEYGNKVAKALTDAPNVECTVFQNEDAFECLELIQHRRVDVVYIGPGLKNADFDDFYRWVKGVNLDENMAIVCHLPCSSAMSFNEISVILGSEVNDVMVGHLDDAEIVARITHALSKKRLEIGLLSQVEMLKVETATDDLTGLSNMKGFRQGYRSLFQKCIDKEVRGVAVYMLDLDHFKSVNDTYNHLVGSHTIKEIGGILGGLPSRSPYDVKARYGGDEFVLAIGVDSEEEAAKFSEMIVERIRKTTVFYDEYSLNVTASVGVCYCSNNFVGNEAELLKGADLMLYKSKESGRNQYHLLNATDPKVLVDAENDRRGKQIAGESESKLNDLTAA